MMTLKKSGHPALSTVCKEVQEGKDQSLLLHVMWTTMYGEKGIGLAAPQLGETQRVIVIHANGFKQGIINPVITKHHGGFITHKEGCLSFPGAQETVVRSKQIIVEGMDQYWRPVKFKLKGLPSYCVQHEIDHLNGICIVDQD